MLRLRFILDGDERTVPLTGPEVRLGRSGDNEVVLPDYSVSRRHAALRPDGGHWHIFDLKSTNGVQLNNADIQQRSIVRNGDLLKIGVFELRVEDVASPGIAPSQVEGTAAYQPSQPPAPEASDAAYGAPPIAPVAAPPEPPPPPQPDEAVLSNATIVRSLKEFTADYGLEPSAPPIAPVREPSDARLDKRKALDEAYKTRIFGSLTRLARLLITAEAVENVLEKVLDIAFDTLPVDRGFILLRDEQSGELVCEVMRTKERTDFRPQSEVPISRTMLETVMHERVALLTYDALSDQRLAGTESVRIHQIRAAMCAPLWSGEKIIGVMQVDTPHHAGSFIESDVDFLTTLANYCAVAIERIVNANKVSFERQVRSRLERYHSPGVIEEVMGWSGEGGEEMRRLKEAECTVLFADIVGFTAYSEKAPPEEVADLMEGYFTHAVEAIFSAGGTLDKFIGDCVMAFFGAPVQQPDHAERAVRAAVRIFEALDEWNDDREHRGLERIRSRIGINSGPVVVGDIGSNRRVDYTVLGNTVNVASRLESSVAQPGDIIIGEETNRLLKGLLPTESLGARELKGLSRAAEVFRVIRN